jgi:predicted MFS family arabinose efflux permease
MGPAAEADAPSPGAVRRLIAVIASGIFVLGFGWPGLIGRIPFTLLFKNQLGLTADKVAGFWAIGTVAYYLKPLVGIVCDAFPLGGTRRRGYLVWGATAAALFWLAFALAPRAYGPFVALMVLLNLAMVVVSTALGGLQVELSQRHGATGRLAALRSAIEGLMYICGGPVAGLLASVAFGWTAVTGALIVASFIPVAALLYREPPAPRTPALVLAAARAQVRTIMRSRPMWGTAGLILLFFLAPGFQTPLLYIQQDVLRLSPRAMGGLAALAGTGWLVGAALYSRLCRRFTLRTLLMTGIALNGVGALLYQHYDSPRAAALIELTFGVLYMLGMLPLFDLAARATPKGSESFGFGLMLSISNIGQFAISDPVGSLLYARYHFPLSKLVWVNTLSTLAVLLFVPLLPRALLAAREGKAAAGAASGREANRQP